MAGVYLLEVSIRMENESRKSEEQSRKLIRFKNQWFVSTESESDSDDSAMIRIRIDTSNTYSSIETWPDSWHSVSPEAGGNSLFQNVGLGQKLKGSIANFTSWA